MSFTPPNGEEQKKHWELCHAHDHFGAIVTVRRILCDRLFDRLYYLPKKTLYSWDNVRDNELSMNWVYYGPQSTRISDLDFY